MIENPVTKEIKTTTNNTGVFITKSNGCYFGDIANPKNADQDGCWTINGDEEFWERWKEYFEACNYQDFLLIHESKAMYNHQIVWLVITLAIKTVATTASKAWVKNQREIQKPMIVILKQVIGEYL
ncbi:hypothetical protein CLU79DRAFT_720034 [Phycomyces nitens]|nr:hypothetical protein CLU79DRAFT_720034 [Phycomyces nitens]